MGLVAVQVSVVEMAEKEILKPVVGTFVGQAEKHDYALSKAQSDRFFFAQRVVLSRDAIKEVKYKTAGMYKPIKSTLEHPTVFEMCN